jgi:hypothetical protein
VMFVGFFSSDVSEITGRVLGLADSAFEVCVVVAGSRVGGVRKFRVGRCVKTAAIWLRSLQVPVLRLV